MKNIKGKIVLITGVGLGNGKLLALKMDKEGARILIWDINKKNI